MHKNNDMIPISEKLDKVIEDSMRIVNRTQRKKRFQKTAGFTTGIAAACALFLMWGFSNPVLAAKLPLIGNIFTKVEDKTSFSGNYSEKAEKLGVADDGAAEETAGQLTSNDSGLEVTASEVYSDGYSVYISFALNKEEAFGNMASYSTDTDSEENEMQFLYTSGQWSIGEGGKKAELMNNHMEGEKVDENQFAGMLKLDLTELDYAGQDSFVVNLELERLMYDALDDPQDTGTEEPYNQITGQWNLAIPVTVDRENVKEFLVDHQENGVGIGKVVLTPYELKIESTIGTGEDYGTAAFDQDGERITFEYEEAIKGGFFSTFSLKGKEMKKIYLYIGEDSIGMIKETNQQEAERRAILKTEIEVN